MAGISKPVASFIITPHKLAICILVQVYAPHSQISIPFPFSSVSQHNCLGIFLLALIKACDGIFEPTLDELIAQLREICGLLNHWFNDHFTRRLLSLASPDDLFNFFTDLRGILGGCDSTVMNDDMIMLDPNSIIGMFVRRCLLSFNQMSFEGICHLLTNIGTYCKESLSDIDRSLRGLDDIDMPTRPSCCAYSSSEMPRGIGSPNGSFLHTNWQVQGYLSEQADAIEKHGSSFSFNAFESLLNKLQKSASELHRVHYLHYLNSLYHDDFPGALENLHRYFDYSAGTEGVVHVPLLSGCSSFGRYEIALLCLGMMHFHFGHPRQAFEVLTEAVRVSQQ